MINSPLSRLVILVPFLFLVGLLPSGCSSLKWRGQSPDESTKSKSNSASQDYIRDITSLWGLNYAKVEGIALATQLDSSGSDPRPSQQRSYLVSEMRAHEVAKPNEVLASENTSLVLVRGFMPPGVKKGDRFDVEVRTLPRSDTKSLEGGFLMETRLRQMEALGGQVLQGHIVGSVKGSIIVDSIFEKGDEVNKTRGRVLGTAVAMYDRPLGLVVNSENHSVRITTALARAINKRFHVIENGGKVGAATPKNDRHIELAVPQRYKHHLGRYLEVVRCIKYREADHEISRRLIDLKERLMHPETCRRAALQLEAIGNQAKPLLLEGMESGESDVRFYSAMALAYMDTPEAARELGSAAKVQPAFRWHAMTALSSMDDIYAGEQLSELLNMRSAETRYGAFQAMRERSPSRSIFESEFRPDDFYLHIVPSESFPLMHFSRARRPEIVLFGPEQTVNDSFLIIQPGLTMKAGEDAEIKITQFTRRDGDKTVVCSSLISDLIREMVELDMDYGQILEIFQKAKTAGMLETKLVIDATPDPRRQYRRAKETESDSGDSERFVAAPIPDFFRNNKGRQQKWRPDESGVYYEDENRKNVFSRMTGWWSGK